MNTILERFLNLAVPTYLFFPVPRWTEIDERDPVAIRRRFVEVNRRTESDDDLALPHAA